MAITYYWENRKTGEVIAVEGREGGRPQQLQNLGYDSRDYRYVTNSYVQDKIERNAPNSAEVFATASRLGVDVNELLQQNKGKKFSDTVKKAQEEIVNRAQDKGYFAPDASSQSLAKIRQQQYDEQKQQEQQLQENAQTAKAKADAYFFYTKNYGISGDVAQQRLTGNYPIYEDEARKNNDYESISRKLLPSDSEKLQKRIIQLQGEGYNNAEILNIINTGLPNPEPIASSYFGGVVYRDRTPNNIVRPNASYERDFQQKKEIENRLSGYGQYTASNNPQSYFSPISAENQKRILFAKQTLQKIGSAGKVSAEIGQATADIVSETGATVGKGFYKATAGAQQTLAQEQKVILTDKNYNYTASHDRLFAVFKDPDVINTQLMAGTVAASIVLPTVGTAVGGAFVGYTGYKFATNPSPRTGVEFALSLPGSGLIRGGKAIRAFASDFTGEGLVLVSRTKIRQPFFTPIKDTNVFIESLSINPKRTALSNQRGEFLDMSLTVNSRSKPIINMYEETYRTQLGLEIKRKVLSYERLATTDTIFGSVNLKNPPKTVLFQGRGVSDSRREFQSIIIGDFKASSVNTGQKRTNRYIELSADIDLKNVDDLSGYGTVRSRADFKGEKELTTQPFSFDSKSIKGKMFITEDFIFDDVQYYTFDSRKPYSPPTRNRARTNKVLSVLDTEQYQTTISKKGNKYAIKLSDESFARKITSVFSDSKSYGVIKPEIKLEFIKDLGDDVFVSKTKVLPAEKKIMTYQVMSRNAQQKLKKQTQRREVGIFDSMSTELLDLPRPLKKVTDFDYIGLGSKGDFENIYVQNKRKVSLKNKELSVINGNNKIISSSENFSRPEKLLYDTIQKKIYETVVNKLDIPQPSISTFKTENFHEKIYTESSNIKKYTTFSIGTEATQLYSYKKKRLNPYQTKYVLLKNLAQANRYDTSLSYDIKIKKEIAKKTGIVNKLNYASKNKLAYKPQNDLMTQAKNNFPVPSFPIPSPPPHSPPPPESPPPSIKIPRLEFDLQKKKKKEEKKLKPKKIRLKTARTPTAYAIGFGIKGKTNDFSYYSGLGGRFVTEPKQNKPRYERYNQMFSKVPAAFKSRVKYNYTGSVPKGLNIIKRKVTSGERNNFSITKVSKGTFYGRKRF